MARPPRRNNERSLKPHVLSPLHYYFFKLSAQTVVSQRPIFSSETQFPEHFHPKTTDLPEFEKSILILNKRYDFYLILLDFITKRPHFYDF